MKRSLIKHRVAIAIPLLPLMLVGASLAGAQQNANSSNKELSLNEIVKLPGKLLSEAKNTGQSGDLKLTGYRVEEVLLPRSVNAEVRGRQVVTDKAWRVIVTGGPFPVRTMPAVIWIDDEVAGYGIENETLSQITAVTFDSALIHQDGVVSFSYGEYKEGRVRLAPRLQLKREGENQ